ncbi:uncharacterized protein LOC116339595 [Contarinia nasturtii]|uniref:uncharacterized protein LOC116339595 n=1 Tax=Contarinia nasturtii TaxID=265458 RepID=UPI0012D407CE|nr:uncharacterized protein LOC116339595 [Contarinia nasturtii]
MSEITLPKYIQDHLDRISNENGFIDYSMQVKQGTQTGDGLMSVLWSVTIAEHNSDEKLYLVCKVAPLSRNRRKEFISNVSFKREADFYTNLMPSFSKFQEDKNLSKDDQFLAYPKCYGAIIDDKNENYAIILEDLSHQEFKSWDKAKTSPFENVRLAMREIGKFHGISFAMKDQRPDEFAEFEQFTDIYKIFFESQNMQDMINDSYEQAIVSLKSENYKNVMCDLKNNFLEYFDECLNEKSSTYFGVICHGDFWTNNCLFKFNENGAAEDIRFLDWPVIRYGSPAIDLLFYLFTSTDKTLRDKEYDNLLQLYYESLSKTVKLLGSSPELFTYENLQSELKRCGSFALLLAPLSIQVQQADTNEVANLNEMCDKMANGNNSDGLVNDLNEEAQLIYEQRLNDVFEDVIRLGYINNAN